MYNLVASPGGDVAVPPGRLPDRLDGQSVTASTPPSACAVAPGSGSSRASRSVGAKFLHDGIGDQPSLPNASSQHGRKPLGGCRHPRNGYDLDYIWR